MISAVVPTIAAGERLESCLLSVRESLIWSSDDWELLVVDDGATGLGPQPEWVRVVPLSPRGGYGAAVNAGARVASGARLLVLNDDVRLEAETVAQLRAALESRIDLFAVTPAIRSPRAICGDEGGKVATFVAGQIAIEEAAAQQTHATLYPVGCCYLCRRESFLELGGYTDVYAPYYWEDVDLGYRAWRRGLATLHVPNAVCHHEGSATIGQRPMAERHAVWTRNMALFHLRNLQAPERRAAYYGALLASALFDERESVRGGLAEALRRYGDDPLVPEGGLTDDAILERVRGS